MWSSLKQHLSAAFRGQDELENRTHGFHVLWVEDGSIAEKVGIESYYDFICEVDGVELSDDSEWLCSYLSGALHPFRIKLWSLKDQKSRYLTLAPCKRLGLSLRWCSISAVQKTVWHVLSIEKGSPAEISGLLAYDDYIVGTPECRLHGESDLELLVDRFMNMSLQLYVYNSHYETTRLVTLIPNRKWGGSGALGCGLGYGYLHQLPRTSKERAMQMPVETDVYPCSEEHNGQGILSTETMFGEMSFVATSTPQSKKLRRQRQSGKICDEAVLELMKEGEAKSEQIAQGESCLYNNEVVQKMGKSYKEAPLEKNDENARSHSQDINIFGSQSAVNE